MPRWNCCDGWSRELKALTRNGGFPPLDTRTALRLEVSGIVQGVGFRPFVHGLARSRGLVGEVANTSCGVLIHVEGEEADLRAFVRDLEDRAPPLAYITHIKERCVPPGHHEGFAIAASIRDAPATVLVPPDVSVCDACLAEVDDPSDRRFGYPFTNCTHCGPRFTIIGGLPYDRPFTSMHRFEMCPACRAEYDDPEDRRFHAQPNACPACGPRLALLDRAGNRIQVSDPLAAAIERLRMGWVVAVKGLGGFHLVVDAANDEAVASLRSRKHREEKPLALMSFGLEQVRHYCAPTPAEERALASRRRPIVLVQKREGDAVSRYVAPGQRCHGVMLPYTPMHHLLTAGGFTALVMTSANLSEEPICIQNGEALERLSGIADAFLAHDREIYQRCDDSVVRVVSGIPRVLRRSRGYVPTPVHLSRSVAPVLGCGAVLKSTFCLTKGRNAFLSQHIGDLETVEAYAFYRKSVEQWKRVLEIEPEIVAHDLHPDYLSTIFASELEGVERIAVQHHHAHVVSCMAENDVDGPVIGVCADGAGLGTDGRIWGGEVLVATRVGFSRAAHLGYVPMPGAAAAIREPWRMGVSYLRHTFGEEGLSVAEDLLGKVPVRNLEVVDRMTTAGVNSPETSSLGRLFDGIAALCGVRERVAYEGQAAMELEALASDGDASAYPVEMDLAARPVVVPVAEIVRGVVGDLRAGVAVPVVSGRFHNTVLRVVERVCETIREDTGIRDVVLSGGVFQNVRLLAGLEADLAGKGFRVHTHAQVPPNDGGISLGQAVIASATIGEGRE